MSEGARLPVVRVILLEFLYDLTEALERHYTGELIRRNCLRQDNSTEDNPDTNPADPADRQMALLTE